jgi:hypothetical protein
MPSSFNYSPPPTAGSVTATASGKLSNGSKVILNSDGTVSVVAAASAAISTVITQTITTSPSGYYNDNSPTGTYSSTDDRVVVFYADNTNYYTYAVVGAISGSTITFGTPGVINSYGTTGISNAIYDVTTNTCCVVGSYYGTATLIAVQTTPNATTFSFTSAGYGGIGVTFGSYNSLGVSAATGKIGFYWYDNSNALMYFKIGNIQTTYPYSTWGSTVNVDASYWGNGYGGIVFNATGSQVILASNSYYDYWANARLYTVSGNTPTLQQFTTFENVNASGNVAIVATNTADKYFAIYRKSSVLWGIVITVSGNTMTFGTPLTIISEGYGSTLSLVCYPVGGDIYIKAGYGVSAKVTVSGTTFAVGAYSVSYDYNGNIFYRSLALQILQIGGTGSGPTYNFSAKIAYSTNLTSSNFLGISSANYGTGALATIQTVGSADDAQSGLTAGNTYSVRADGSLVPYSSSFPYAGLALSPTKLLIKG